MESERQIIKSVLVQCLVVILHIDEQRLLVVQVEVVLDLVVKLYFREFAYVWLNCVDHLTWRILGLFSLVWVLGWTVASQSLLLVRFLLRSRHHRLNRVLLVVPVVHVFYSAFLERKHARKGVHYVHFFDLGPAEVALVQFFFIVLDPPVSIFKQPSDHDWVVSFADVAFVKDVWGWQSHL